MIITKKLALQVCIMDKKVINIIYVYVGKAKAGIIFSVKFICKLFQTDCIIYGATDIDNTKYHYIPIGYHNVDTSQYNTIQFKDLK